MKRREFLKRSIAALSLMSGGSASAQTSVKRAAVVIGINKAGNLPILHAAVSGADQMGRWLTSQNFEVTPFLDSAGTVRRSDIFDKIQEIVNKGFYDQLVVYFAGHGCVVDYSERWLLSRAPVDASEAINVYQSVCLGRQSGIGNLVFISDACRSAPDSIQMSNVVGGVIFPNEDMPPGARTYVDEFYAAHPGEAALERSVDKSTKNYEGIYTSAFLDAFQHPTKDMVALVDGLKVVPNRRLDGFLRTEVSICAAKISLQLSQLPESLVPSPDETYIGRLADDVVTVNSTFTPPPTINDLVNFMIQPAANPPGANPTRDLPVGLPDALTQVFGFEAFSASVLQVIAELQIIERIGFETGFAIWGANVSDITVSADFKAYLIPVIPALIMIESGSRQSGSLVLRFADGAGSVFAILKGFIGNVTVSEAGVANISYNPSKQNVRYAEFETEKSRLDLLRAGVAAAAKFGVLSKLQNDLNIRRRRAEAFR